MRANNVMTNLTKAEVAEMMVKDTSPEDCIEWLLDLIVEHEHESILMRYLEDMHPELVYPDAEASAEDAADAAYESARDEGLFEDGRLWA